ncbi:MAG: NAD-dependent epimerase/dehydratase family protein [Myxococcaceae bacterium]
MKVVVTGGAGFIGSHIVENFHQRAEVVVVDNLRSGYRHNLEGFKVKLVEESITNLDCLMEVCAGADYIFHLAAMVSVPESMDRPKECVDINVNGLLNVLEAARRHKVKKVVHSSSAAIYGDSEVVPKTEGMTPEPISPYGITKLDGEYYLSMYRRAYGVPTVSLRYFNVFGPRQDPKSQYAAVVPIFIANAVAGRDLTIYGDGEQTRDFIYVKDIVGANELVARNEAAHGTYNVALGGRMSVNGLAKKILERTGSKARIVHAPGRAGDVRHSQASVERITAAGFKPSFGVDGGLEPTIAFFRGK